MTNYQRLQEELRRQEGRISTIQDSLERLAKHIVGGLTEFLEAPRSAVRLHEEARRSGLYGRTHWITFLLNGETRTLIRLELIYREGDIWLRLSCELHQFDLVVISIPMAARLQEAALSKTYELFLKGMKDYISFYGHDGFPRARVRQGAEF